MSEDKLLNEKYFKGKTHGTFVDIGSHNGIAGSNTYFFESELHWDGLCVEPIPEVFEDLKKNRKCHLFNACLWNENTSKKFRRVTGIGESLSGIVDAYHPTQKLRIENHYYEDSIEIEDLDLPCYDVNTILDSFKLYNVDFMSIDTEGSEEVILKHLDYDKFKIYIIVVENNYNNQEINRFLTEKGYIFADGMGVNEIYVKKSQ
jgi:FkbM family methyltransferase